MTKTHELVFDTPARNQGQIVTYSYARSKSGAVIVCRSDASDRSVYYYWQQSQRRLSAQELERYGLAERN